MRPTRHFLFPLPLYRDRECRRGEEEGDGASQRRGSASMSSHGGTEARAMEGRAPAWRGSGSRGKG
jgi:hypothetical protein